MDALDGILWGTAIATYGFGDTLTTVGVREEFPDRFEEKNPVANRILDAGGVGGFVIAKGLALGAGALVWEAMDEGATEPYSAAVPGVYALGGGAATVMNLRQLESI